jgi:hypothetical protein
MSDLVDGGGPQEKTEEKTHTRGDGTGDSTLLQSSASTDEGLGAGTEPERC